jgi:hypothetical protein
MSRRGTEDDPAKHASAAAAIDGFLSAKGVFIG